MGALDGPFVYDDFLHFVDRPKILNPTGWSDIFKNGLQETRPLFNLSLAIQAKVFGTNVMAAHAINLALHVATGITFYFLVLGLGGPKSISFVSALLFLVHPICVESVAYFNSRSGVMGLFFSLLGFLCVTKPGMKWWGIGFLALLSGIASKEDAIGTILVILLWDFWRQYRGESSWDWKRRMAIVSAIASVPVLFFFFRSPHIDTVGFDVQPWWNYLWEQGVQIPLHLSLYLWPDPLTFNRDLPSGLFSPWIVGLGWIAIGSAAAFFWRIKKSWISFALGWDFLALLPTHSVVPLLDLQASRILYPMVPGLALSSAVLIVTYIYPHWKRVAWVLGTFLILGFSCRTQYLVSLWKDPIKLWERNVEAAPSRWRAWVNYAVELAESSRWKEASDALQRAEKIHPRNVSIIYNAAAIAVSRTDGQKDSGLAIKKLNLALKIDPNHRRSKALLKRLKTSGPER